MDALFWACWLCGRTWGLCNSQLDVLEQATGLLTTSGVAVKELRHRQSNWMHAGCKAPAEDAQIWSCYMRSPCGAGREAVLTGWSPDAPAAQLPEDVSFSVGAGTGLASVVLQVTYFFHTAPLTYQKPGLHQCFNFVMDLQVHYAQGRPKGDAPGFRLSMIAQPTPYSAGMITFASDFAVSDIVALLGTPSSLCSV